jgi:hypothetical protein
VVRPVRFLIWEPGQATAQETDGELVEIPHEGSRFWHGSSAFRVERVEEARTPRIHLTRDPEREARLREGLADAYVLSVGQSDVEGRLWCAEVVAPGGRLLGVAHDNECDAAAEAARTQALHALAVEAGYHPEREVE